MVAASFSFDDFDFIIYSFQPSGTDGVITMVENSVTITAKHLGELHHFIDENAKRVTDLRRVFVLEEKVVYQE